MLDFGMVLPIEFPRPISDEEIEALTALNPNLWFERTGEGELIVSPPAGGESSVRTVDLSRQLIEWNERAGAGIVFDAQAGFRLPDGALLSPDAAWLAKSRWEALDAKTRKKFLPLCPNLVFEVHSPSDYFGAAQLKIAAYVRNGASCAVLLDPERRKAAIHERSGNVQVLSNPASVRISVALLPGAQADFELDLRTIFA